MDYIKDFLSFDILISPYILTLFYILGALLVPLITWKLVQVLKLKFLNKIPYFTIAFIILFVFAELFWRILFEYLIAFMQIHEALTSK